MKTLEKLLLTNWHYLSHEVMNFGQINFLTGENGSGKTTIIDAMQVVILGDTAGKFFNKSASEKSSRSLKGYLKCEYGENDDGTPLYLRNGKFSSYLAMQFNDDIKNNKFTVGIVFDIMEDGSHNGTYFYFNGPLPENEFIENNVPLSTKQLNLFLLNNYSDVKMFQTNIDYKEFIKVKFGNLSDTFFGLFKKAIPFTPINDIEKFITEYVCEVENSIDVEKMQENFRNYKVLEIETEILTKRVDKLRNICEKYNEYKAKKESILVKKYIVDRSALHIASQAESKINERVNELKEDKEECKALLNKCDQLIKDTNRKLDNLKEEKFQSDSFQRQAIFQEKYDSLVKQINSLTDALVDVRNNLTNYINEWSEAINDSFIDLGSEFINSENGKKAKNIQKLLKELQDEVKGDNVPFNTLNNLYNTINDFQASVKEYQFKILDKNIQIKNQINVLEDEIETINSGKKPYDPRLIEFRDAIADGLKRKTCKEISVEFLSDLIDIKDESWRNAIETYLNTQRFYLIVDSDYIDDALRIYNNIKDTLPTYDYGIIDTEKVVRNVRDPLASSLATEVTSENEGAKAYIDFLIGALVKCENISHIRDNSRSITRDGMLYQNFVVRRLLCKDTRSFIGSKAGNSQKAIKEKEIKQLNSDLNIVNVQISALGKLTGLEFLNSNEVKNISSTYERCEHLESYIKERDENKKIIDGYQDNYLEAIEKQISNVEAELKGYQDERDRIIQDINKADNSIAHNINDLLPESKKKVEELKVIIGQTYSREWLVSTGEPAFLDLLKENNNIVHIYNQFKSEIDQTDHQLQNSWNYICDLRMRYNAEYELNYDHRNLDNTEYDNEYHALGEVKLVEYINKIKEAKDNAMKEFRNDFLSKLKNNFDTVQTQIESLNSALEHVKFGADSYLFSVDPRPEYKEYYEMINDPLLLTGTDIENEDFMNKYKDTIENLFRQITFTDSADQRAELMKNVEKFTNYTSYLKFDLIVTNETGVKQRLSKTLNRKSGGETQTPFYISVLASFSQAYRLYMNNEKINPIRLIIFDEAFSKMDRNRVEESIKLLRSFGLQALISAPSDKAAIITPLVDKTLCVVRSGNQSTIRDFYKK